MNEELIRLKKTCEYRRKMLERQWDKFDSIDLDEHNKRLVQYSMVGSFAHYYAATLEKYIEALERVINEQI